MNKLLLICCFGVAGVMTRYFVVTSIGRISGAANFPFATLLINVFGSLLIGFCAALAAGSERLSGDVYAGIVIGFLGGFTTFSSFSLEVLNLFDSRQLQLALLYLFGSPCLGVAAAAVGMQFGKLFES
jgi:CrcB protein